MRAPSVADDAPASAADNGSPHTGSSAPPHVEPGLPDSASAPVSAASLPDRSRWRLPASFQALSHRNYQLLWLGNLISNTGDWMDQIAFNWLVYQLTDSAIYLGLVSLCRWVPILIFTIIGGVVADRMERRRLMFATQATAMLLALALALLVATNHVQIWMVLLIAFGRGVAMSFDQPARQSLVSELVPRKDLRNAIALNSAAFNLSRIAGPAIGGILIATVGVAGAFFLNAASFLAVLGGLALMRIPPRRRTAPRGVLADLVGGLRYVRAQPVLLTLLMLALVPVILGMPYMTMLTVIARDVLDVGGTGLGILTACASVGAVAGAVFVAVLHNAERRGQLMLAALVVFGLSLLGLAASHLVWVSALALLIVGFSQQVYMTVNNTIVQEGVDEEYRGRVLSILFLNRGMIPLGAMLAGFGTELFGVQLTIGAMAAAMVLVALLAARFAPATRELR